MLSAASGLSGPRPFRAEPFATVEWFDTFHQQRQRQWAVYGGAKQAQLLEVLIGARPESAAVAAHPSAPRGVSVMGRNRVIKKGAEFSHSGAHDFFCFGRKSARAGAGSCRK